MSKSDHYKELESNELINDKKKISSINNNERDLNIKCIDSHDKVVINNDIKFTNDSNKYDIRQNNDILNIDSVLIEPNNKIFNSLHYDNINTPINNNIIVENTNTDEFISSNKNNDGNNSIILNIAKDNNETHENINEDMFIDSLITIIGNDEVDLSSYTSTGKGNTAENHGGVHDFGEHADLEMGNVDEEKELDLEEMKHNISQAVSETLSKYFNQ